MLLADYEFYVISYAGTLITEADWPAAVREASAFVDDLTYRRLHRQLSSYQLPDEVRMAVCAVAEAVARYNAGQVLRIAGVSSETVGAHSVTYATADAQLAEKRRSMRQAAELYLPLSHPLRYAGVDRC